MIQFSMLISYSLHYILTFFLDIYLIHEYGWYRIGLGSKKLKKMRFHIREWACCGIRIHFGCRGIGHPRAGCLGIQIACLGIQGSSDTMGYMVSARTLKNCHLILGQAFKVIPLGEVSYKSLVSAKNNKHTSLNQNLDDWNGFPQLCQNRGANTAANFQKS